MMQEKFRDSGGYTYKSEITGILSSMAFGEDSYDKKISSLSGGEKTRLSLACLLLRKPDILFLDEPTNHLDIGTLKWLEQYLKSYKGTIVLVSHDRYFLDNIVDRIFAFEGEGRLTQYEGGYTDYAQAVNKKGAVSDIQGGKSAADSEEDKNRKKASQADWKQNRPQKLKFSYKEQREFETIDDEIAALEEKLEKLDKDMEANATNSMKLREIMEEKENTQQKLDEKMDRWVYLNDLAERIQAQKV